MQITAAECAGDAAELAAAWIARRLRSAVRRTGRATLALSGGSTAPALIAALARRDLAWDSVDIFQVDERLAPDGDAARNASQLIALPGRHHLMPVIADDLQRAADDYAGRLPEHLDVVHLGLGEDGHTASWPPGDDDVIASPHLVTTVAAFNGLARMTMTPLAVNAARARLVLVVGAGKRAMLERWLLGDPRLPIATLRRSGTAVFLDLAAAPTIAGSAALGAG